MPLMRSFQQPDSPSLALSLADTSRGDGQYEIWILLASTVCVPWPMPDFLPVL